MAIGPSELDAIISYEIGVDHFGGDAGRGDFEEVGGVNWKAHVFVPTLAFGAGADIADACQWVFAVHAIEPVDDHEVVGAVDGDVLGTGIGHRDGIAPGDAKMFWFS